MELTGKRFWILGLQFIVILSILSCTTKKISSPVALGNIFTPAFFQTDEYLSVIDYLGKNLCLQDEMERYTYKICVKIDSLGFVKQATLIDVVQHSHNDSILLYGHKSIVSSLSCSSERCIFLKRLNSSSWRGCSSVMRYKASTLIRRSYLYRSRLSG